MRDWLRVLEFVTGHQDYGWFFGCAWLDRPSAWARGGRRDKPRQQPAELWLGCLAAAAWLKCRG